jgi:predicted dehydrogenase
MPNKIRLGIIGANMHSQWASRSHFPALLASADWEVGAPPPRRHHARVRFGS